MKTIANTAILSEIEMQKIKNATEGLPIRSSMPSQTNLDHC
jgi:hypothetical protein